MGVPYKPHNPEIYDRVENVEYDGQVTVINGFDTVLIGNVRGIKTTLTADESMQLFGIAPDQSALFMFEIADASKIKSGSFLKFSEDNSTWIVATPVAIHNALIGYAQCLLEGEVIDE